jgi:hypothetical protein
MRMNPTDIYEALDAIAKTPFDPGEFGLRFAEATDNAQSTISRLRNGTLNMSDIESGVLLNQKFHYAPCSSDQVEETLARLKASRRTTKYKPAIIIATDGITVAAEHLKSGESLHCGFQEIGDHFGFFLPAAGKDRYKPAEENPVDIKATGKLAKLYDALIKANPEWGSDARRHDMNQFMARLIFCMFAEDVGIFPEHQFSRAIFTHAGGRGEEARPVLVSAFEAMNLPQAKRTHMPAWSHELEYVNGGLFAGTIDAPDFDTLSYRYFREACDLNWREINPDIFGSMIQSVADPETRAELGMHYTSVPNIMKVLGPLFLDEIDNEIEKAWDRPKSLEKIIDRMAKIRVFDPACGSGNFLVVAYRELRAREIRIIKRLGELTGQIQVKMWSDISISSFYGIEIVDFAAETAKLAMFIAEHQANSLFREAVGQMPAALPLRKSAQITTGNALRICWIKACPDLEDESLDVYLAGNPPFYGAKKRTADQNDDMNRSGLSGLGLLDYVAGWIEKASALRRKQLDAAFVVTSSICQGEQVSKLWPRVLGRECFIRFAYRPFKWKNSAADNAGVSVAIIGLTRDPSPQRSIYEGDIQNTYANITPYLAPGAFQPVSSHSNGLFNMPTMLMGSNPVDGRRLILSEDDKSVLLAEDPRARDFIKPYMGGDELLYDRPRYCLWVEDDKIQQAMDISSIANRINSCRTYRNTGGRDAKRAADRPHKFCYSTWQSSPALMIPNTQSEEREYVPAAPIPADVVVNHAAFVIYNCPDYVLPIISSKLHRVWLATVGGRLEGRFRYSVRLVYNSFPVPQFTKKQVSDLAEAGRNILKQRYKNHPMTLAELYDPVKMPENLRKAHKEGDDLIEMMYSGRSFRTDTERLEHLFKLYAAKVRKMQEAA